MSDALRRAYGLGPALPSKALSASPSPLWLATEQARREYQSMCIAFSNQEASESQLLTAARKLRDLQLQWKNA